MPGIAITASARVAERLLSTNLAGEVVILDVQSGYYFGLKGAGVIAWEMLQRGCRLEAIVDRIASQYDVSRATAEADVVDLVETLRRRGLVDVEPAP